MAKQRFKATKSAPSLNAGIDFKPKPPKVMPSKAPPLQPGRKRRGVKGSNLSLAMSKRGGY